MEGDPLKKQTYSCPMSDNILTWPFCEPSVPPQSRASLLYRVMHSQGVKQNLTLCMCKVHTHIYIHKQIHGIFVTLNFGRWAIRRKMCWEGKYLKKKKKRLLRRIIMEKSRDAQAFSLFSPENNLHSFWVGTELEILFLFIDFLLVSQYSENLMPLSLKPFLGSLLQSDSNLRLGITLISVCQSVVSTFSAKSVTCLYFLNIYRICTSCSLCCCGLILLYSLILMTV